MRFSLNLLLLITLFCCSSAYSEEYTGPNIRKEARALAGSWNRSLKARIAQCDRVEVTACWYATTESKRYTINDDRAVSQLIAAIEVTEDHNGASNTGMGYYRFTFFKGAKAVATINEMGNCLAWEDGPWIGTPPRTETSIRAMRAWVKQHL